MLCGRGFDIGVLAGFKAVAKVALVSRHTLRAICVPQAGLRTPGAGPPPVVSGARTPTGPDTGGARTPTGLRVQRITP